MPIQKGWFIRSKEPNTVFWSLRAGKDYWVPDMADALLFARKTDAEDYFVVVFNPEAQKQYQIDGVN